MNVTTARIRGEPEGNTPRERIDAWLARLPAVGEKMIWVGKDYSLAQLKDDVRAVLEIRTDK